MRFRQVFEQQMPSDIFGSIEGLKTARHYSFPQVRRDVAVERDFAAVRVRWMACTIKAAHLENHGSGGIFGRTFILKPQPKSVRPQFWKGSHHRDVANRCLAE